MRNFVSSAWLVARHDLRVMLSQKETLLWTFLMPGIFFWFIGTITGNFDGASGGSLDRIGVAVPESAGFLADALEERLADSDIKVNRATSEVPIANYRRRLELPDDLTAGVLAGESKSVRFETDLEGLTAPYDEFRVQRAALTLAADLAVLAAEGSEPSAEALAELRARERPLKLTTRRATRDRTARIPNGFEQAVPGTMVMFTLVILLTTGATTLLFERRGGVLRRLASAPMSRGSVVAGKWFGKLALAGVQVGFAMLLGAIAFKVHWGPHYVGVIALLFAYAAFLSSAALLVGNFATSEGQAVALGVLSGNVLGALGGCWWPIEVTPPFMQKLALFMPTGWAMDGLHKLMSFGMTSSSVLPHVAGMLVGALALGWVVQRTFKFQ